MQETVVITGKITANQVNRNYDYITGKEVTSINSTEGVPIKHSCKNYFRCW